MTRREVPLDAGEILRVIARHRVDHVVIGGLAVQAHGHTRTTQGVDLVPAPDQANLGRLAEALRELGAHEPDAEPEALEIETRLRRQSTLALDCAAGGIDIHLQPAGAPPFDELRARALELSVAGVELRVAGLDDLIAMKRASGRPIDRGDVIALTEPGPGDGEKLRNRR